MRISLSFLVVLLTASTLFAQELQFEQYSVADGLSNPTVTDIAQDQRGFLWITTNLGLNRFDGYSIKQYLPDPTDSTSLPAAFLNNVLVDHKDRVWIGTGVGLYRLDPGSNQFTIYDVEDSHQIKPLIQGKDGVIWFAQEDPDLLKIGRLDPETESLTWHSDILPGTTSGIQSAIQGADGLLWFATRGTGLFSYDVDANTVVRYQHDPSDERSLISNDVTVVFEDSRGTLWVGTAGDGLHTMDRNTGLFTRYQTDLSNPNQLSRPYQNDDPEAGFVSEIYEDREGIIWIGAIQGGFLRFDPSTGRVIRHVNAGSSSVDSGVDHFYLSSIVQTHDGSLWFGSWDGSLSRLLPPSQRGVSFISRPQKPDLQAPAFVFFQDSSGTQWWGTEGNGLLKTDGETGRVTAFQFDPGNASSLSNNVVTALHRDKTGVLWVGTIGGLNRFDSETGTFTRFQHEPDNVYSLSDDFVKNIYEDQAGELWITTLGGGLHRIHPVTSVVERLFTPPTYPPALRDLLDRFDRENRSLGAILKNRPGQLLDHPLKIDEETPVLIVHQTNIITNNWVNDQGLIVRKGEEEPLYMLKPEESGYGGGAVLNRIKVVVDTLSPGDYELQIRSFSNNYGYELWRGAPPDHPERWGLQVYSLDGVDLAAIKDAIQMSSPDNKGMEGHLYAYTILEDADGTLWVNTDAGFHRLNRETDTFVMDPDKPRIDRPFHKVLMTGQNGGWIGTTWSGKEGNRLIHFDGASDTRSKLATSIGLSFSVNFLMEDDEGRIWSHNTEGPGVIDPGSMRLRPFDMSKALASTSFSPNLVLDANRKSGGSLYFTLPEGVAVIDTDLAFDKTVPRVTLTGIRVFEEPVQFESGSLDNQKTPFMLAHHSNEVTFDYVGIYFPKAEQTAYAYRLDGYDEEWRDAGSQRTATYTNLRPGDYTFRVKAANADGYWNEEGASVSFTIQPPWWRTTPLFLLYGLILAAGIYSVDRFQRRRLIAREREKARERELAQAKEIEKAYTLYPAQNHPAATHTTGEDGLAGAAHGRHRPRDQEPAEFREQLRRTDQRPPGRLAEQPGSTHRR